MEHRTTVESLVLIPDKYERLRVGSTGRWKPFWKRRFVPVLLVLTDLSLALLAWGAASLVQGIWGTGALTTATVVATVPAIIVWVLMRALLGLYPGYGLGSAEQLRRHAFATFAALAVLAIFALTLRAGPMISRLQVLLVFLGLLVLAPFAQHLAKMVMRRVGVWGKPVVILGYKEAGEKVVRGLAEEWGLGYDPVAVFDYRLDRSAALASNAVERQATADVLTLAGDHGVDTAIFAMPNTRREQLANLVGLVKLSLQHVLIIPNLEGLTNSAVVARDLGGTFAVEIKYNLLNPWALRAKRVMDLIITVPGAALLLPLVLVLALWVRLESGGPVFYTDKRMGKDGKLFSCVKFRTMVSDAEAVLHRMLEEDAVSRDEYSKYHKLRDDPRVTRVGGFMRKTSLDELPQLWNVLRGEMSLVGPRPYLPRESQEIGAAQGEILRVPPGITGPWQVAGRNRTFFGERIQIDVCYVGDWSMWLDIIILARTVRTLLLDRAAY